MASTKVSVLYQLAESMRTEWVLACATAWGESTAPAEESPTLVPSLVLPWSPRGRVRVRVLSSAQSHAEGSETWEDGSLRLLKGSKRKAHAQISVPLKGGSSHFAVGSHTGLCWGDALSPSPCCTHRQQCPGPGTNPPALLLERSLYWNAFPGYSPVCSFMSCKVSRSGSAGSVGSLFIL